MCQSGITRWLLDQLRLLDFDDLYLLRLLLNGASVTGAAKQLGLTQPAITQRLRKIERVFQCPVVQRHGRSVSLTKEAASLCERATAAISLMSTDLSVERSQVINVATRPESGHNWLGPALMALRRGHPEIVYHCFLGSGEEILRMLAAGRVDAVLTSAPHMVREYGAIDVCEESYVMVAAARIAKELKRPEHLQGQMLIEYDRSFPFQRYLKPETRAKLKFKDVWFLGSTALMVQAVVEGLGVSIVPRYLVSSLLEKGKVVTLFESEPGFAMQSDWFRLIFRNDRDLAPPMTVLAEALRKSGMR